MRIKRHSNLYTKKYKSKRSRERAKQMHDGEENRLKELRERLDEERKKKEEMVKKLNVE